DFLRQWQGSGSEGGGASGEGEIGDERQAFRELGVEPGAALQTVTKAFRRLVKELHPDRRNGDRSAEPRLRRLVAAYEFIKKRGSARPS
ncbi:MAG TPA: DnaJ domain-containing protein, partial [Nitrospiria bacterium]